MVTVTRYSDIGYEVICEPDDNYKYIRCESSKAGLFFLRFGNNMCDLWTLKDGKSYWSNIEFSPLCQDTPTCKFFEVHEKHSRILPSVEQYLASESN